jgi:hypothetical protein
MACRRETADTQTVHQGGRVHRLDAAVAVFGASSLFEDALAEAPYMFEAQIMGNFARDLICTKADEPISGGAFTHHFKHLNLRPADQPGVVQSVLDGNNDPRDQLPIVLMIVWRFRNNLFHGEKWAYQLQDQLSNFTHANAVLMPCWNDMDNWSRNHHQISRSPRSKAATGA